MKRRMYFSSLFLLFLGMCSHAQTLDSVANQRIVKDFENLATAQLKENIYIHTDKDIYEPGEDLWFKAYLLNGNNLKRSRYTNIIFVELYKLEKEHPELILQEKFEASNGFANGYLFLAEILEDGDYQLIIHTKNTLESAKKELVAVKQIQLKTSIIPSILIDTEFSKKSYSRHNNIDLDIAVFSRSRAPYVNASVTATLYAGSKKIDRIRLKTNQTGETSISFPAEKSKKATTIQLHVKDGKKVVEHVVDIPFKNVAAIQFSMFPEGGKLVENLPNTLAFKAVDHHGKPLNIKGELYENGKRIHTFKAAHYGMGKFSFTPKTNRAYTVKLTNPKLDSVFQVPDIVPTGIKLQVDQQTQKQVQFSITKTEDISNQTVYIRAQSRGIVYWMAMATLSKQRIRFELPLDELPQGIAEVTIFDANFQPIAERLIYANSDQKLHITLTDINKSMFKQKDKVTLKFKVQDQFKKPVIANVSLSVYDHLYANKDNDYSIMPHYYLFSELKGHVYDAGYYFDEKNKQRAKHLDLLLLTQGWRNYVWNTSYLETSKHIKFSTNIQGKLFKKTANGTLQNAENAEMRIVFPESVELAYANKNGRFSFSPALLKIAQGHQMTLFPVQADSMFLEIQNPFEKIEQITKEHRITFPRTDVIKAAKKQSSYDSKFSFSETNYLEEVNLTSYRNRNKNRGKGVLFHGSDTDYICFEFNILNCVNHSAGNKPIVGERYRLNDGTTVLYTGPNKKYSKKSQNFVYVKGLYPTKEFYQPVYDTADEKAFPDNRKTLFWAPNLVADKNGIIKVSFYTSDVQTTFFGKLEGTNGNGLLGSNVFQFDVN